MRRRPQRAQQPAERGVGERAARHRKIHQAHAVRRRQREALERVGRRLERRRRAQRRRANVRGRRGVALLAERAQLGQRRERAVEVVADWVHFVGRDEAQRRTPRL